VISVAKSGNTDPFKTNPLKTKSFIRTTNGAFPFTPGIKLGKEKEY